MERKNLFKKGDLVWAKIRGFPWWPGIVQTSKVKLGSNKEESSKEIRVLVNFLGDNTHAEIPLQKIENFVKKYEVFSKTKKKSLQKAITIANKLLKGEIVSDTNNKPICEKMKREKKTIKPSNIEVSMISPITIEELSVKKQLLNKRYREKSGKKYREFIKVLKKKSSKKEESLQDNDYDNPSSTINTHIEENLNINMKKSEEMNTILSIRSSESVGDFKKEIESLIFSRVNSPASSVKNILIKLETMKKKVLENNDKRFDEVNIIISYRQLVNELVPLLKQFLNHNNIEIRKLAHEIILMIKDKVFSMIFNNNERVDDYIFDFEMEKLSKSEIIKYLDIQLSKEILCGERSKCIFSEKNNKNSIESSSLNNSSDTRHEFLVNCLIKRQNKKPKFNIIPLYNDQIFYLLKEFIEIETDSCDEYIEKLKTIEIIYTKNISVPETKKILRKNICIQFLNVFEKLMLNIDISVLKKVVILLEYKLRERDPDLGQVYQDHIKKIFLKIKTFFIECDRSEDKQN